MAKKTPLKPATKTKRISAPAKRKINPKAPLLVLTIGHSTRPIQEFIDLLKAHEVKCIADVRTVPRSRYNPQFNRDTLPDSLETAGIDYVHLSELGGFRPTVPDSVNMGWRNTSFRGYADYMQTPEFSEAIEHLIILVKGQRIAVMCAEAVPWRCHRSLIADALLVRGIHCEDITNATRRLVHKLTPFAKVRGTKITYPPLPSTPPSQPAPIKRTARKSVAKPKPKSKSKV